MRSDEESVPLVEYDLQDEKYSSDYYFHGPLARRLSTAGRALAQYVGPQRLATCTHILSRITDRTRNILRRRRGSGCGTSPSPAATQTPSRTEWLNGVRGVAALFVFWYHFQYFYHGEFTSRMGYNGGPPGQEHDNRWIMQLPFIRLLLSGDTMVSVFFVVSGFSLSIKPISLIRQQEHSKLLTSLSSSTWRRAGRLYLPCLCVTFLSGVIGTQLGLHEFGRDATADQEAVPGKPDKIPTMMPTLWLQIVDWATVMKWWIRPFELDPTWTSSYDPHLWTIPWEFRCSIMLFLVQLGVARIRTPFRILASVGIWLYCLFEIQQWEMALFMAGFIIADLDAVRLARRVALKTIATTNTTSIRRRISRAIWSTLLVIALFLMSQPSQWAANSMGYKTIFAFSDSIVPDGFRARDRYPQIVGSMLFIWSLTHLSPVRRLFATAPARFLGRISFMLYAVHHPMNSIVGFRIVLGVRSLLAGSWHTSFIMKEVCFFVALPIHTALCVGMAELLTRYVDNKCLQFVRWVEKKCVYAAEPQQRPGAIAGGDVSAHQS